jgi:ABC-type Fe3+/spermidine/putrescine transport system ATPase subunit
VKPLLEVLGLGRSFSGREVLREVSFRLDSGEAAIVVGRSGAGKTTLLRLLAGLDVPDRGQVLVRGQEGLPPPQRDMQMLFQDLALFPHLTILENVRFTAGSDQAARDWLARVGWSGRHGDRPDRLSGGERQRVALARALAGKPALLLLDEPFLNLDPPARRELLAELGRLQFEEGFAMLYVTHHLEEALLVGRRLLFLEQGELALDGPLPLVLEQSANPAFARFLDGHVQGGAPAVPVAGFAGPRALRVLADPAGEGRIEGRLMGPRECLWLARQGELWVRFLGPADLQEGQPVRVEDEG